MATIPSKADVEATTPNSAANVPAWPRGEASSANISTSPSHNNSGNGHSPQDGSAHKPSRRDALQALLAFASLHEQLRRRRGLAAQHNAFDAGARVGEFDEGEPVVLDEVLQLVAERAVAITGADGLAIALAENDEIVLRAAAGTVRPDVGARIDRDSAFSGASFRTAQIVNCDDTETDARVNLQACRRLGARSMVAVPLCGRRRVIGLLEAFSSWPFGFNQSDVRNLTLLAELVVSALKPEDEDRFADAAQAAATRFAEPPRPAASLPPVSFREEARVEAPAPAVESKPTVEPTSPPIASPAPAPAWPSQTASTSTIAAPTQASPLSEPSIPVEPAPRSADVPEFELPDVNQTVSEPVLTLGQEQEEERHRPGVLVVLICIVVAAAFAGGVWVKWKTSQLSGMIVHNEPAASQPAGSAATTTSTQTRGVNPGTAADAEMTPDASERNTAPTPQELAKFPRVTGVRHWASADSSSVVFDLEDQVQYEAHRLPDPDRIYFDLHDTQLAPELAGKSIEVGDTLLNRIRVAQPVSGMTRVVLETRGSSNFSVSLEPNPYRLVVEVRKIGANPRGTVNLFPGVEGAKRLAIVIPPPTREDLQLRAHVPKMRIVVDAGHGGWDLGTVGRRGLLEKDLVLEIAERLGKLLESRLGMEVVYTRQDDNYIALDERAEIANQAQADLFVSVHANYSDLPSARGVETYYTNTFSPPGSREAGTKDADAHTGMITKNDATPPLAPADLRERTEQSRRLAASVQRSLYGTLAVQNPGLRDRGIKEAGFVVLTESAMPGILAEVSFVSSPTDEQKLRSDGYRERIAEALYRGIARFAASSKGLKVASAKK
jgi:N-acetylmuramoyl-L-alanine amidase/putative methionine-R-sulfoxide reductase with GAF domain